jgi:hypothetical protein
MKIFNFATAALITVSLGFFVACGSSKSGQNKIAVTPTNTCMLPNGIQGNCDTSFYGQVAGFSVYPYNGSGYYGNTNNYAGGLCACNNGSRPVYNSQFGLGCMATNYVNVNAGFYSFGWNSGNSSWYGLPQVAYQPFVSSAGSNCFNDVAYVCDVRLANSCGNTGFCRPVSGASSVGLCVFTTSTQNGYSYGYSY